MIPEILNLEKHLTKPKNIVFSNSRLLIYFFYRRYSFFKAWSDPYRLSCPSFIPSVYPLSLIDWLLSTSWYLSLFGALVKFTINHCLTAAREFLQAIDLVGARYIIFFIYFILLFIYYLYLDITFFWQIHKCDTRFSHCKKEHMVKLDISVIWSFYLIHVFLYKNIPCPNSSYYV